MAAADPDRELVLDERHRYRACDLIVETRGAARLPERSFARKFEILEIGVAGPEDEHAPGRTLTVQRRSEEHTSELQSLMRTSYAVFCLKKKKQPMHHVELSAPQTR